MPHLESKMMRQETMTSETLFYEFIYGLFVMWVASYSGERFNSSLTKFLTVAAVAVVLILVVNISGVMPKGQNISRMFLYIIGLYLGIKAGTYSYRLRNPA